MDINTLYIFTGMPGSGKTTNTNGYARRTQYKDCILRDEFLGSIEKQLELYEKYIFLDGLSIVDNYINFRANRKSPPYTIDDIFAAIDKLLVRRKIEITFSFCTAMEHKFARKENRLENFGEVSKW